MLQLTTKKYHRYSMENNPSPHKKEIKKAWLFTIILHLIIAGVLITYWYFNQSQKPDPVTTNLQAQAKPMPEPVALPPLKTELASAPSFDPIPTNTDTTLTQNNNTTLASVPQTTQPEAVPTQNTTPPIKVETDNKNIDKERPLSKYINNQNPNTNAGTTKTVNTATTMATTQNSKQGLTQRDLPRNEMPKTQNTKQKPEQQEMAKLSQEVEKENDKISKLIEQVKNQNQRKIDENIAKNRPTDIEKLQPAQKNEPIIEKTERLLPTPIPVEINPQPLQSTPSSSD